MPIDIQQLLKGYSRFRKKYFNHSATLYKKLSKQGQKPSALIIACCDSRVDPAIILDCNPGDLFVVRNVANLVPPCEYDHHYHGTSAALEFGVTALKIPHIIVLGHSQCGGIRSLLSRHRKSPNTFISKWMDLALPSSDVKIKKLSSLSTNKKADLYARISLAGSIQNLMTFPWIKKRVKAKKLNLHAWYFNISKGTLDIYNHATHDFETLSK